MSGLLCAVCRKAIWLFVLGALAAQLAQAQKGVSRPMGQVVWEMIGVGRSVTYEDCRYGAEDVIVSRSEIRDEGVQVRTMEFAAPRHGVTVFSRGLLTDKVEDQLRSAAELHSTLGNPCAFQVSGVVDGYHHVFPQGESVLGVQVSISGLERDPSDGTVDGLDYLNFLTRALTTASGHKVGFGMLPIPPNQRVDLPMVGEGRSLLTGLVSALYAPHRVSWFLLWGPEDGGYALNIAEIQEGGQKRPWR